MTEDQIYSRMDDLELERKYGADDEPADDPDARRDAEIQAAWEQYEASRIAQRGIRKLKPISAEVVQINLAAFKA